MVRKRHRAEEIIGHLREAEVELSKGQSVARSASGLGSPSRLITAGERSMAVSGRIKPSG